jgi:aminoglycoside phosphotransferase (APT) family kinase protein
VDTTELEACLPAALRGPTTAITRIAAGMSGAGVYRVTAGGAAYVLKVTRPEDPPDAWTARTQVLRAAAEAGLAPRVVHVDEARRAVVTELVVDRSFGARFTDPRTHAAALGELGATLRRVHALPLPPGAAPMESRAFLARSWAGLGDFPLPAWNADVVRRVLDEAPPAGRAPVLSHNDANPTNLVYDGKRVLLLDWDNAGANDPLYDLAAVAVFFRMDDATCAQLIAAHDEAAVEVPLPARFRYQRREIAALCGALFLSLARAAGHPGARGGETFELTLTLADVHARLRVGELSARTADGQFAYGQALLKESTRA